LEREGIGKIIWVKSENNNREHDLRKLRVKMLTEKKPIAGVFIGGMDGVYDAKSDSDEFHLFMQICEGKPIYPIGTTGGASRALLTYVWEHQQLLKSWNYSVMKLEELSQPTPYSTLTKKIVLDIIQHEAKRRLKKNT